MFNLNFSEALRGGRRSDRTKPVSLKEAKEHMEQYYESKTPGYVAMSKKRDAEVSKQGKYLLIPNTPESVKYLEEGGVKYYDMLGVDAFDSDTFTMKDKDGVAQTYNTKKAATTKEGQTYSNKFREEYKKRWKTTNIVNFRWIKDYEKRILGLEKQLDNIKGTDAKKEVRQQINRLKGKIKALQDPKTTTVLENKTRVESESEYEYEDFQWSEEDLF